MEPYCHLDECHVPIPHAHGTDGAPPVFETAPSMSAPQAASLSVEDVPEFAPTKTRPGDQALPQGGIECVQDLVIAAMEESKRVGQERYGSPLMTFNGRKGIQDIAEEARDLMVYATQIEAEAQAARKTLLNVTVVALHGAYTKQQGGADKMMMTTSYQRVLSRQAEAAVDAIMGWVVGQITNQGWDAQTLESNILDYIQAGIYAEKTWGEIAKGLTDAILAGPKGQS